VGRLAHILDHVKKCHSDRLTSRNYFNCYSIEDVEWLTIYKGELFLYYKYIKEGIWHASVYSVGLTTAKFKGVFILRSHDETSNEAIEMSFAVDLIDTFESVFKSGRCLILDEIVVRNFIQNRQMNMAVSIEEINTS
jgi:hypothetical protein